MFPRWSQGFDSLYTSVDEDTQGEIPNLFRIDGQSKFEMAEMQKQEGTDDCV